MADEILTKVLHAMRAEPRKGKGAVYRWLWAHHDALLKAFAETDAGWAAVSSAMREAGVMGTHGQPPTRKSLPRVWARVLRDKAAAAGGSAPRAKPMPSRIAPGWQPPVVPAAPGLGEGIGAGRPVEAERRKMRVLRSLDDVRPVTDSGPAEDAGPAASPGVGILPPARWPKPFT